VRMLGQRSWVWVLDHSEVGVKRWGRLKSWPHEWIWCYGVDQLGESNHRRAKRHSSNLKPSVRLLQWCLTPNRRSTWPRC